MVKKAFRLREVLLGREVLKDCKIHDLVNRYRNVNSNIKIAIEANLIKALIWKLN